MNKSALEEVVAGLYRAAAGLEAWSCALSAASAVLHGETAALRQALDEGAGGAMPAFDRPSIGLVPYMTGNGAGLAALAPDAVCAEALPLSDDARRIVFHLREALLTAEACVRVVGLGPAVLDQLTLPMLLLEPAGQIRFLNGAAMRELAGAGPLLRRDGRLMGRDPVADGLLHGFLAAVAREPGVAAAPVLAGPPGPDGARRVALQAIPAALAGQSLLLLVLHELDRPRLPSLVTLMRVYRMTPAQAQVTLALLRGLTPEEVAAERHVSSHTVRDQIAAVFAKTGVTRQAELVARLAALPTALLGLE